MRKLFIVIILVLLVALAYQVLSNKNESVVTSPDETSVTKPETNNGDLEIPEENETGDSDMEVLAEPETKEMNEESDPVVRAFTLDSFSFGYSETELRVNEGDTVTINLTNSGGFHDWVVDEFNAATDKISAGDATSVTFVADKVGTFEFYCSVGSHRAQGMVGSLIVE